MQVSDVTPAAGQFSLPLQPHRQCCQPCRTQPPASGHIHLRIGREGGREGGRERERGREKGRERERAREREEGGREGREEGGRRERGQ